MSDNNQHLKLVPALERGARILDLVAKSKDNLTISKISKELGIAKSSVHTLCNTLVQLELLLRRPDQSFHLGPHVMRWSNAFTQQSDVVKEFATIWDHEAELPGATITLSVLEDSEVVYIAARNSTASSSLIDFRIGMRIPAAFTATGKSFLSYLSDFEVKRLFSDGFPTSRTPHSVQDIDTLLAELDGVRQNGYSFDDEQVAEGVVCFGASVLNSQNRPIAGVAVSLPVEKLDAAQKTRAIEDVQRIAKKISHRMGADLHS
ncbi:MAG: IclR family transcriptional regulator [Rhizobiales bacterium]|nr:IclR family transcriptional regulator [Hyphomicrobiales bacterium]